MFRIVFFFGVLPAILLSGCGESDVLIRKKLDALLQSDMKAITAGLPAEGLLKEPFYTVVSYKIYREGMYSRMAVADFYFMNKIKVKIVRKYRYYASARLWDRYFNEYVFYGDSVQNKPR
jgi:hypothetical protein